MLTRCMHHAEVLLDWFQKDIMIIMNDIKLLQQADQSLVLFSKVGLHNPEPRFRDPKYHNQGLQQNLENNHNQILWYDLLLNQKSRHK